MTKKDYTESDFIKNQIELLNDGFSESQIKQDVWSYCLRKYNSCLRLDAIIHLSMGIYSEIILEHKKNEIRD